MPPGAAYRPAGWARSFRVTAIGGRGSMNTEEAWDAKWREELDRRGIRSVTATLSSGDIRPGRGAEFHLFLGGTPNPSRGYVEDWISRKQAEATGIDTKRFWYLLIASVVAAAASVIAAWPVIQD